MTDIPKTLDWVKARTDCAVGAIFLALSEVVRADVASIQQRVPRAKFMISTPTAETLLVGKTEEMAGGIDAGQAVVFELVPGQGIRVKDARTRAERFFARPVLQPSGDCQLEIQGESAPLELWQVSRRALEDLFFS